MHGRVECTRGREVVTRPDVEEMGEALHGNKNDHHQIPHVEKQTPFHPEQDIGNLCVRNYSQGKYTVEIGTLTCVD